jgi:hypothetical protein
MGRNFDRAYGVLQADKTVMSEDCKSLVTQVLARKVGEYFELSSPLNMEIVKLEGEYHVRITFKAERIKHFQILK